MSLNLGKQEREILTRAIALLGAPVFDVQVVVNVDSPYAETVTYVTTMDGNDGRLTTMRWGGNAIHGGSFEQHARHILDRVTGRKGQIRNIELSRGEGEQAITLWDSAL